MSGQRVCNSHTKDAKPSNMNACGRGASVLGGWRLGGSAAFVLHMQPFNVNWQLVDANLT